MRRLTLGLDALLFLRDSAGVKECDLTAAAALAELAGANALRVGINDDLRPATERDVQDLRRAARVFELRMAPTQSLFKVALEARPDRVVLAGNAWEGPRASTPLDPRADAAAIGPLVRGLEEAGIGVVAVVAPDIDAVKAAHGLGVKGVEFYTGGIVDLPEYERRSEMEALGDAVRIASKLRLREIAIGGSLDFFTAAEMVSAAPAADSVAVGRALVARSILIGLDRSIRDFRDLIS